ncbi:MAG: porin family protein [Tannerellaceae bacterium]|nr:porin family protein [Tannerellaceae bacterium]
MKRLIFTLAVALGIVTSVSAQDYSAWIGGSLGVSHSENKLDGTGTNTKQTDYDLLPELGIYLSERFGIAIKVGYEHTEISHRDNGVKTKTKGHDVVINPFVRYLFLQGTIGSLFVDGGAGVKFGKSDGSTLTEFTIGIKPGAMINIGNGFSLLTTFGNFGYNHTKIKTEPRTKDNDFNFGFNLNNVTMGMIYSF